LASARTFPTLAGITDLSAADWDGDAQVEVFQLSSDERQLGVTRLDSNGRLPFPTLVSLEGRPLVLAVGQLETGAKPTLVVVIDKDGKRSLVIRQADGKTREIILRDEYRSTPNTLAFHDVDQDGLADLVILTPYEKIKILRQLPDAEFTEIDVSPPGGAIEQPWLGKADVDGDRKPELLLTQKNFVRAVVLEKGGAPGATQSGWAFTVKEQINGATSSSRLAGAVAVPAPSNNVPALFLLDVERKALTLCERDTDGVWKVTRNLPLPVSEFSGLEAVALRSTNANAVAFVGLNSVGLMPFCGQVWDLVELDGYETPIRDGRLTDVVSGDLDSDGRKDLVFLETGRNYLDLVVFDAEHKLVPANRWQVFEERTFLARRSAQPEPREAVVDDVTGDGKNDLVVLVHDRILVYPQE
jgi:hypothetical protein